MALQIIDLSWWPEAAAAAAAGNQGRPPISELPGFWLLNPFHLLILRCQQSRQRKTDRQTQEEKRKKGEAELMEDKRLQRWREVHDKQREKRRSREWMSRTGQVGHAYVLWRPRDGKKIILLPLRGEERHGGGGGGSVSEKLNHKQERGFLGFFQVAAVRDSGPYFSSHVWTAVFTPRPWRDGWCSETGSCNLILANKDKKVIESQSWLKSAFGASRGSAQAGV